MPSTKYDTYVRWIEKDADLIYFYSFRDDILVLKMAFHCCTCVSVILAGGVLKDIKEVVHSCFGRKLFGLK